MDTSIKIKGIKDGILIQVSEGEWEQLNAALIGQIQQQAVFLKGAALTLDLGNHVLSASELGKLRDTLSDMDIHLRTVLSYSPKTETIARLLGLGTRLPEPRPERTTRKLDTNLQGEVAVFLQRTLRSGFKLEHTGHVTVLGDVNPGAEIIAGGSVVVWGRLRGTVHAGAFGDAHAVVCALEMAPTQLRLAGEIAAPSKPSRKPVPEIAMLKNGKVIAEPWKVKGKI